MSIHYCTSYRVILQCTSNFLNTLYMHIKFHVWLIYSFKIIEKVYVILDSPLVEAKVFDLLE